VLYAALTFWLMVIVLAAWGVHRLWSGMVKPKVLNAVLIPGTLVAQVGHVLGLLVTGATISNTTVYGDDDSGAPSTTPNPKPKIPVIGPVVIGLLPLFACAMGILVAARYLGGPFRSGLEQDVVGPVLPTSLAGVWQMLRDLITLAESLVATVATADFTNWATWVFLYLLACLSVQIAPFPGNLRGALGAILVLGVGGAALSSWLDVADPRVQNVWSVLNLTVGTLLFLLLLSLLVRGGVGLVKVLSNDS